MSRSTFRILLVDDDPVQIKLAKAVLEAHGFAAPSAVGTAAEALARGPDHDLILLAVQLPDGNGLDVLRKLRERSTRPAVIIVTGHGAETIAAEALRLGADDYVSKDAGFIDLLPTVVERVRRSIALRDMLESTEREVVDAERRSAVGELTVALHHELNNPLMAALTEATLLQEEPALSPTLRTGLAVIKAALERIKEVVKRAGAADGAKSTDYLVGSLRMTDLDAPGMMRGLRGRALLATEDVALRRIIAVLLRREGFELESLDSLEEVATRLTEAPVPSVVVVAGIPSGDTDPLGVSRPGASRSWALVVISAPSAGGTLGSHADLALRLPFDPATFAGQVVGAVECWRVGG